MDLAEYYAIYGSRISQDSERLFVDEFLYPLLGKKIGLVIPQHPFLDRTGKARRIDFAYIEHGCRLALEVNGETYHAEGIIPDSQFDDNLFRQNEILNAGFRLVRFSYNQLQSPQWRQLIQETLRDLFANAAPELLTEYHLEPNYIQAEALHALDFYRTTREWRKAIVVMPTGTGKTILSALDAKRYGGRVLFLVHRLDILKQSIDAYKMVWPSLRTGLLTGDVKEAVDQCDVLFASKDTLRQTNELDRFPRDWFNYIVVDEVHHGQSPTYRDILEYFTPSFMLGMTATPDRMDRRDIFELFDYNKAYEIPLHEAIERGFLVPYTYYGLTDNVDYTKIRYQNNKYRVDDLERYLIIPERNDAIIQQYLEKGNGDKAIGFCVSIPHAERMAEFFRERGVTARAVHSLATDRDTIIKEFRDNKIQVVFTVDLFNEGVDFPNTRVLLFLRPTESKTVFVQQLGRGLRLCTGKDRVRVLDFIGNYKRANLIRDYLAKDKRTIEVEENGRRRRKVEYIYSPGCEVRFDEQVEEILDRQDAESLGIGKLELKEAYFTLAENLASKPTRVEIDEQGEYKSALYARVFGSWVAFLREIGEYTEASYHYPQGTHLGHILSIVTYFGRETRQGTHLDDKFIRMRGELGEGRLSTYRRQIKYKLQAAMELGVIEDDRRAGADAGFVPQLTPDGGDMLRELGPFLAGLDLSFPVGEDGIPTTRMNADEASYNQVLRRAIRESASARAVIYRVCLGMHAVQQMMAFLYHVRREVVIPRQEIYQQFFQAPFVKQFCDQEGIEEATLEAAKRRCPFLLNVLDAIGVIEAERQSVNVNSLVLLPCLVRPYAREETEVSLKRLRSLKAAWPSNSDRLSGEDVSILRELFGPSFLTDAYPIKDATFLESL